jgi:hypothetical protein
LQIVHQLRRHGPGERRLGLGGTVARIADQPHFVFQLNHDDGVLFGIHFAEMLHEGGVGAGVGLQVGVAGRREHFHRLAALEPGAREPLLVGLHPRGREAGEAVLPTAEPEEDDVQIIFPRAGEQSVNEAEIVFAFHRLDPVPADATRTVLRFILASFGQTVSMYSRLEEAVLSVSPARTRYGLPSTINCVAAPRFSRCAMDGSGVVWEFAVVRASEKIAARLQRVFSLINFSVRWETCLNPVNLAVLVQGVFIGSQLHWLFSCSG